MVVYIFEGIFFRRNNEIWNQINNLRSSSVLLGFWDSMCFMDSVFYAIYHPAPNRCVQLWRGCHFSSCMKIGGKGSSLQIHLRIYSHSILGLVHSESTTHSTDGTLQSHRNRTCHPDTLIIGTVILMPWIPYQIRKIAGCACAGNAGNIFSATDFKWSR